MALEAAKSQYRQVADLLRAAIEREDYAPVSLLPFESELAAEWVVSRVTINRAVQFLRGEGMVRVLRGKGTAVRAIPPIRRNSTLRCARGSREEEGLSRSSFWSPWAPVHSMASSWRSLTRRRCQKGSRELSLSRLMGAGESLEFGYLLSYLVPEFSLYHRFIEKAESRRRRALIISVLTDSLIEDYQTRGLKALLKRTFTSGAEARTLSFRSN